MKQLAIRLSWQTTPAKSLVMFEHAVRVLQPPDQSSNAGYPAGAANWGRFLLVTFLGKTRKVTSCRATPGGFDFDCWVSLRSTQPTLLQNSTITGSATGADQQCRRVRSSTFGHESLIYGDADAGGCLTAGQAACGARRNKSASRFLILLFHHPGTLHDQLFFLEDFPEIPVAGINGAYAFGCSGHQ